MCSARALRHTGSEGRAASPSIANHRRYEGHARANSSPQRSPGTFSATQRKRIWDVDPADVRGATPVRGA